jgi:hypothetical protein
VRELTLKRIREGLAKAKCYGTRSGRPIGRPPRQTPASFKKYYPMCKDGDITVADVARLVGVIRPTLYKYIEVQESTPNNSKNSYRFLTATNVCYTYALGNTYFIIKILPISLPVRNEKIHKRNNICCSRVQSLYKQVL